MQEHVCWQQEDEGMSVDIADNAEKNELIVDVKGIEKEGTNEVELVGLQLLSLNRYQDCNNT
jgi:hypothetical protein